MKTTRVEIAINAQKWEQAANRAKEMGMTMTAYLGWIIGKDVREANREKNKKSWREPKG